jgi:CheY-like chemotaxis protein
MNEAQHSDVVSEIGRKLPYLRRYARALTGSQVSGDAFAAATLEALLEDDTVIAQSSSVKVALFKAFHAIWSSSGSPVEEGDDGIRARAQRHLRGLTTNSREALLLHTIEELSFAEIAEVMEVGPSDAEELVGIARREMEDRISGKVMIIEDEAIIAMDIQSIVAEMGHGITGVANTHAKALELGRRERPDLILADIQLADNSSGIEAVNDLLGMFGETPVIFITAFPDRLLTGKRPEPAFLISKPYNEEQVRSAVSQAMFFASTETLVA